MKKQSKESTFKKLYAVLLKLSESGNTSLMADFQAKNKVGLIALNTQVEQLFEKHVVKGANGFERHRSKWWKFWEDKVRYKCKSEKDEIEFVTAWNKIMKKPIIIYY